MADDEKTTRAGPALCAAQSAESVPRAFRLRGLFLRLGDQHRLGGLLRQRRTALHRTLAAEHELVLGDLDADGKLDKERYRRLKQTGLDQDKSSQEIFVEALDAYLAQHRG